METLVWSKIKEKNEWPPILLEKLVGTYSEPRFYYANERVSFECPIHGIVTRKIYDCCTDLSEIGELKCPKCSRLAGAAKARETNMERYGAPTPAQNKDVLAKMKATSLERYGSVSSFGNKEVQEKSRQTNLKKYGVEYAITNTEVKAARDQAMIDKYGTIHALQTEDSLNKFKDTMNERFGTTYALENEELKQKHWDTMEELYGDKHALKVPEFMQKMKDTNMERFNATGISQTYDGYVKIQTTKNFTPVSRETWDTFNNKEPFKAFILSLTKDGEKPTLKDISTAIGFSMSATGQKVMLYDLGNLVQYLGGESYAEYEIMEFLENYDIKCIHRYHKGRNEIDVYLPEYKIGVEFNGLYWHSDLMKEKSYHYDKKKYFEDHEINIINVYEDEWADEAKKIIIKSIILATCNISIDKTILYARKLKIVEISHDNEGLQKIKTFYEENHLQGYRQSSIHVALVDDHNNIVECMSFGYAFFGNKGNTKNYQYELIRHCTKIFTNVVGGKERIFKYFLNNYPKDDSFNTYMVTYCDTDKFSGNSYLTLGFKFVSHSPQVWGVINNVERVNRNPSNNNIFKELPKIYGCGNDKYIYD